MEYINIININMKIYKNKIEIQELTNYVRK